MAGGRACHLVENGEAAVDLARRGPVLLDDPGEILPEAGEEEGIIVPDEKACLDEEVGEISLQILRDTLKMGPRVAVNRRFALLHQCSLHLLVAARTLRH